MMLNPNCSESVVRIDTKELKSKRIRKLILEHFKDTKAFYEDETDGNDWYSYLLKYMKLKENKDFGEKIIYCSRFEGEDDFMLDIPFIDFLYTNSDLHEAQEKGIMLKTSIKGTRRWKYKGER